MTTADFKLAIVIPSLNRKEKLINCVESIKQAKRRFDVNLYLYFSTRKELAYFSNLFRGDDWIHCRLVKNYKTSTFWNKFLKTMKEDALLYANDDVLFFRDTIEQAITYMIRLYPDTDGLLGIRQSNLPDNQALKTAFGVIGKKFADRFPDRQVFCPEYFRFYGDQELYDFATKIGKFTFCHLLQIKHLHPAFNKGYIDDTHIDVRRYWENDKITYHSRRSKGLLWGINYLTINKE